MFKSLLCRKTKLPDVGHQEKEQPLETLLTPVFREGALIEFTGKRGISVVTDTERLLGARFLQLKAGDMLLYLNSIAVDNEVYLEEAAPGCAHLFNLWTHQNKITKEVLNLTGQYRGNVLYSIFHRFLFQDNVIRIIDETANLLNDFKYAYQPRP